MYRFVLKLVGILVVVGVVWWRMEGKPLPGFLSDDDDRGPSGLVYGPDGEIDMSQVYGNRIVDVSVTNSKLHDRALRIISALTGEGLDPLKSHLGELIRANQTSDENSERMEK